jgi:hypothetical protein
MHLAERKRLAKWSQAKTSKGHVTVLTRHQLDNFQSPNHTQSLDNSIEHDMRVNNCVKFSQTS